MTTVVSIRDGLFFVFFFGSEVSTMDEYEAACNNLHHEFHVQ
jgi:hypothetical protein